MNHLPSSTRLRSSSLFLTALAIATLIAMLTPQQAAACGCFHSPEPPPEAPDAASFAVNQQAEQIIFEVGGGEITAHVLIKYAGDPAQFAWMVPVPTLPVLDLSENLVFSVLDDSTAPNIQINAENICPDPEYICRYRSVPDCTPDDFFSSSSGFSTSDAFSGGDTSSRNPDGGTPGVTVLSSEVIGSYQTVVFQAEEADLAVQWLQDNGFIVNDSMTPYMQPYIDAQMLFVAAKLVPDAGIDEIRPLKMTYEGDLPMIPLQLTAVAAEPHLTVTSYIFADTQFQPSGHPLATVSPNDLAEWGAPTRIGKRNNYPMLLARVIDEAGGDAFVREYANETSRLDLFPDPTGCCSGATFCEPFANDGQCQCPGYESDVDDCSGIEGLSTAIESLQALSGNHNYLTRLTTRISPEEMTFDPLFEPAPSNTTIGVLTLSNTEPNFDGCESDVVDPAAYDLTIQRQACATVYCGVGGECGVVADGSPGCACGAGQVAKRFTDLDGSASVTCVPAQHTVDLGLNTELPDACNGVSCGNGVCVDVGGFPTCQCDAGSVAITLAGQSAPVCETLVQSTGDSGARDYSQALREAKICAPRPPTCGDDGWLVPNPNKRIQGELCESSTPSDASLLEVKPDYICINGQAVAPNSGNDESSSCSCSALRQDTSGRGSSPAGGALLFAGFLAAAFVLRRRRG